MERDPCPDRILDDIGGAFGMGTVGGGAFYFLKGLKNSPRGSRLRDAMQNARMKTPATAGGFAVWGGLFSLSDCSLVYLRQKEDPWNSIMAGAFTGAFLQMRQGFASASRGALFGGTFLALIEGLQIAVHRFEAAQKQQIMYVEHNNVPIGTGNQGNEDLQETAGASGSASSSVSSWFGGWFGGGGKKQEEKSGAKTEVLESFDAPMPPTFEFK